MSHAPDTAAAAATAAASSSAPPLPAVAAAPWNAIPYLLQRYCHDDPKKLNDFRLPELDALCEIGQTHTLARRVRVGCGHSRNAALQRCPHSLSA